MSQITFLVVKGKGKSHTNTECLEVATLYNKGRGHKSDAGITKDGPSGHRTQAGTKQSSEEPVLQGPWQNATHGAKTSKSVFFQL